MHLCKKVSRDKQGYYKRTTSVVQKVMKGIPGDEIYLHLERQALIRDSQYGFEHHQPYAPY